ncbi:T6SS phospholipase effector Tle1-like catalytic domain-containing protein [Collimonas antrihumi]|uniref:phospholipase effector Tle1 domain-containing protein n=1 Tax=Collimonas antrihumi TaxID=1940615 RepID=UPI001B8A8D8E|nr:DUF2235 domain-containing protein [Collimonas antrihumi]
MSEPILSAPPRISSSATEEMTPKTVNVASRILKDQQPTVNAPPCQKLINIGLFFDGTNNNMIRDMPQQCHTNVVKMFNAHKDVNEKGALQEPGHYKFYVPGLGTRFPENLEWRETTDGKAFGKGGQARILFALLEVYNAIYRAFSEDAFMFSRQEITAKIQQYAKDIETNDPLGDPKTPRPTRRSWFDELSKILDEKLSKARQDRQQPVIPKITLNVFGFSRGAVEARAFCYWFSDVLKDGKLASMRAEINFLGLFDSVASIGPANSASETTPLFFADGHFSWAKEIRKPLPGCVKKTVHYVAAHEQRRNFPLTRVKGNDVTEYMYPGVHSDVGGGYSPGDQGRGMTMGTMLSQIPLLHMHRAATTAGVPLLSHAQMPSDLTADYDLSSDLSEAWNFYMKALDFKPEADFKIEPNGTVMGSYHAMVREHMRLFYSFRRRYLNEYQNIPSFSKASKQDQEDLNSYNELLKGDLAVLRGREKNATRYVSGISDRHITHASKEAQFANAWQRLLAGTSVPPGKNEIWALKQFDQATDSTEPHYMSLLINQVHDSLASFYLAGYSSDEDKAEKLLTLARKYSKPGQAPSGSYDRQVWDAYQQDPVAMDIVKQRIDAYNDVDKTGGLRLEKFQALNSANQQTPFTQEEQAVLAKCFPLQTDADTGQLLNPFMRTQTGTRREGSGFLRQRVVFE